MIKSVVIHQPNFLPRLKVFIKIAISDVWVIYDDVQYVRREWQNRVFLRDAQQREILFTAPIHKSNFYEKINNIRLENVYKLNQRLKRHIQCNYSKAPYFDCLVDYIDELINKTANVYNLATYNVISTNIALQKLGINIEEKYSSELQKHSTDRNGKLIEICKKSNSVNYICGSGGRSYIDENAFKQENINIIFYDYSEISNDFCEDISKYRNCSFLDFVAYNGLDKLNGLIGYVKSSQIERHKEGGLSCG